MRGAAYHFVPLTVALGCTSLPGIDGEYELRATNVAGAASSSGGQTESGGSGGVPEATGGSSGGVGASGGTAGSGGSDAGSGGVPPSDAGGECLATEKRCARCVTPDPSVGCTLEGCDPCSSAPTNGYLICVDGQCAFDCKADFTRTGNNTCDPVAAGTGGATGAGGTGIGPKHCTTAASCPKCGPFPACCNLLTYCGCSYPANPVCI